MILIEAKQSEYYTLNMYECMWDECMGDEIEIHVYTCREMTLTVNRSRIMSTSLIMYM